MKSKNSKFLSLIRTPLFKLILSSSVLRLASALIGLLFTLYVTNSFDISQAGVILLYFGVFTFLSFNFRFGIDSFIVREINSNNSMMNEFSFFINCYILYFLFAAIGLLVSTLFVSNTLYYIFYITLFFNGSHYIISFIFQANNRPSLSIAFQNLLFIAVTLIFSLIFSVDKPIEFSYCFLASSILTSFLSLFFFLRSTKLQFDGFKLPKLFHKCLPFFLILLFSQVSQWAGQFILGYHDETELVAIFASVQRISLLISFFLISINFVIAPKFAKLYDEGNISSLKKTYFQGLIFTSIFTLPLVLILIVFPEFVLRFFGEEYDQGSASLRILSFAQLINVFTGSVAILLNMTGKEKIVQNVNFVGALCTLALSAILIPFLPLEGAAISMATGIVVVNCINFYFVHTRVFNSRKAAYP